MDIHTLRVRTLSLYTVELIQNYDESSLLEELSSIQYHQYSWLRELLTEPWWIVELTASAGTPTSLTIPEWITRMI